MAAIAGPNGPFYRDQINERMAQGMWWLLAGAGGVIVALSVALAWVVTRPKPPAYIFEVNSRGEYVGKIEPMTGTQAVPEAVILTNINTFIDNAFRVASDQGEETAYLKTTHDLVANQAALKMRTWYFGATGKDKTNNPLALGQTCWREVTNKEVVKQPAPDTYFAHFTTITHALNDGIPVKDNWHLLLKVAMQADAQGEPRFYITYLDFDKEGK
jgi:type IV secretory pathway TrbF-like protein